MRALVNTPGTASDLVRECRGVRAPNMSLPDMFEIGFGLPTAVGHLVTAVRSGIWGKQGREWAVQFAQSIAVGADLRPFADGLVHAVLTDDGKPNPFHDPADRRGAQVARLYERRLSGDEPASAEWRACIPGEAGDTGVWSFAAEAGRLALDLPGPQAVAELLNDAVLQHPPGTFKRDSRALWLLLGRKCIQVAERCKPPPTPDGEPEACVLRQRASPDYSPGDVVCAGTEAYCLGMLGKRPDEPWCVVEGRDSLVTLGVVDAGVGPDEPRCAVESCDRSVLLDAGVDAEDQLSAPLPFDDGPC